MTNVSFNLGQIQYLFTLGQNSVYSEDKYTIQKNNKYIIQLKQI